MENPFNFGQPIHPKKFTGRWEEVNRIAANLINANGMSHIIIGGRRFGKTSFLLAVQDNLINTLNQAQPGERHVIPVLVSLKSLGKRSTEGVFRLMLRTLYDYCYSPFYKDELNVDINLETQTLLYSFIESKEPECSLDRFKEILTDFRTVFWNKYGLLRIVFLLDETEEILEQDWTASTFSNLREIIYVGPLVPYIRYVLTGSSKIVEVREKGSPFLNMLDPTYLKTLPDSEIEKIILWAGSGSIFYVNQVILQSGGHPYLAQYLMYYVWESLQIGQSPSISDIAARFRDERVFIDLEQWKRDIGEAGLIVYNVLAKANTWLTRVQTRQQVNDIKIQKQIRLALTVLRYHGVVFRDGPASNYQYRISGQLFKDWFDEDVLPYLNVPSSDADSTTNGNGSSAIIIHPTNARESYPEIKDIRFANNGIYPTAYCFAIDEEEFPFFSCIIDNTGQNSRERKVTLEVTIQEYGVPLSRTVKIASGEKKSIKLLPKLRNEVIKVLTSKRPAQCRVFAKDTETGRGIIEDDHSIELLPFDTALLAFKDVEGKRVELIKYLAVFVTPYLKAVGELVKMAGGKSREREMPGYQGAEYLLNGQKVVNREKARQISQTQAKAFFNTLKREKRFLYTNSTMSFGRQPGQTMQRVRPPYTSLVLNPGQANCVDGVVLFASLLENVDMEPFIVLVKGHAFVGWRIWKGIDEYDFLETTWISKTEFDEALKEGNAQYQAAIENGDDKRDLFDRNGFMRLVDVVNWHKKGINALPLEE